MAVSMEYRMSNRRSDTHRYYSPYVLNTHRYKTDTSCIVKYTSSSVCIGCIDLYAKHTENSIGEYRTSFAFA